MGKDERRSHGVRSSGKGSTILNIALIVCIISTTLSNCSMRNRISDLEKHTVTLDIQLIGLANKMVHMDEVKTPVIIKSDSLTIPNK